jgi:GNAT superfamily N-acetyltransferase
MGRVSGLRGPAEAGLPPVGPLGPERLAEAGALLARAFADDPLWAWLLPSRERRARRLPALFERALADLGGARLEALGEPLLGCATWLPPGSEGPTTSLRSLADALVRLGSGFPRLVRYAREASRVEAELGAARSWRLGGIGVEPAVQGRGLGSALLRPGLERADAAGLPVVLLTSNPANLPFYERHGFAVRAERPLPAAGPPAWGLVRAAQPANAAHTR